MPPLIVVFHAKQGGENYLLIGHACKGKYLLIAFAQPLEGVLETTLISIPIVVVCCKSLVNYEPVKFRKPAKYIYWKRSRKTPVHFYCLFKVQYKNKH